MFIRRLKYSVVQKEEVSDEAYLARQWVAAWSDHTTNERLFLDDSGPSES